MSWFSQHVGPVAATVNPFMAAPELLDRANKGGSGPGSGSGAVGPAQPSNGYGPGNPSPDLIDRYREVYNRPGVNGDANAAALLWDSKGQSSDWAGQNAYGNFLQMVGREPTQAELAQFIPVFKGAYDQGVAAVANFANLEAQKPANLQKNAPQFAGQVNDVFQNMLGRQATPEEVTHFGGLLASGNADSYQLQDFLRGTPEYQTGEDKKFRGGLASELQGYDTKFFDKAKENVIARFADNGPAHSSALDFALTDLMGKIADKRGEYLSGLSSQQYGGNKELALGNYRNSMNQYLGDQQYNRNLYQSNLQGNMGRANEIGDYFQQQRDFQHSMDGRDVLHPKDYLSLGLYAGNTAARAYGNSQKGGGSGFSYYD